MEKTIIVFNLLQALYGDNMLSKENYKIALNKLIDELDIIRERSKKRILNLDSLILMIKNETI